MIIRLTCLTSALTLAAASKSAKTPGTPAPTDASKAGKSTAPIASKSSKSKISDEYFIAPFSCPQKCISAHGYELESHLLEDAVTECDASDSYQKWKVHRVGAFLKFESAAKYDHNMCLAVVHQDSDHETNTLQWVDVDAPSDHESNTLQWVDEGKELELLGEDGDYIDFFFQGGLVDPHNQYPAYAFGYQFDPKRSGDPVGFGAGPLFVLGLDGLDPMIMYGRGPELLFSENDVDGICNGKLGLAHCSHPGSNWYNTGGNLLSAFCWNHDTPTAMSVDEDCTGMRALNTTNTGDLTTSETFMILGSQ